MYLYDSKVSAPNKVKFWYSYESKEMKIRMQNKKKRHSDKVLLVVFSAARAVDLHVDIESSDCTNEGGRANGVTVPRRDCGKSAFNETTRRYTVGVRQNGTHTGDEFGENHFVNFACCLKSTQERTRGE